MIFSNVIMLFGKETENKAYLVKPNTADWKGDQEQGLFFSRLIQNIGRKLRTKLDLLTPKLLIGKVTENKACYSPT